MVNIRPARLADLESLVELLQMLFELEQDFEGNPSRQQQGLRMMLDNPNGCVMVAQGDGQVIGMCSGQLLISTAEGGPALLVEDVVVREPWRGRGVGRLLMEAISAWAKDKKVDRLQLLADRNNTAALEFYRCLGWQGTELICLRNFIGDKDCR
ncbi:MAG: GNAT family N-acetyltransferase [Desulfobulbaceae bacterium]|nr:GNAT family N-acetyltransferase [Desulfobulbaceae bacterium]